MTWKAWALPSSSVLSGWFALPSPRPNPSESPGSRRHRAALPALLAPTAAGEAGAPSEIRPTPQPGAAWDVVLQWQTGSGGTGDPQCRPGTRMTWQLPREAPGPARRPKPFPSETWWKMVRVWPSSGLLRSTSG